MPITIGANIAALSAQRYLDRASSLTNKSLVRLSSGQRINSASDDAAGLGVAMTLGARQRIFTRANQNIQDGLSALQIVDDALSSANGVLTRMSELAEQAANGSLSYSQRQGLTKEYQQLDLELRRMSRSTSLNGISLLNGEKQRITTQSVFGGLSTLAASTVVGSSGDGRFIASRSGTTLTLTDTDAGTQTVIDTAVPGGTLAMAANGDVAYTKSNQLYYYSRSSGTSRQITNALGGEAYSSLDISADGRTIVFNSSTKYVDGGTVNTSGATYSANRYVYSLNLETATVRQVSTTNNASGLTVSEDGSKVGFYVDLGLAGQEVYIVNMSGTVAVEREVAELLSIGITPVVPGITNDGRLFFTAFEDFTGQNVQGANQLFQYDYNSGQISQLTRSTDQNGWAYSGSISADENSVYLYGSLDLIGQNGNNYSEAYRVEASSGAVTQLTTNTSSYAWTGVPTISRDGSRLIGIVGGNIASASTSARALGFDVETGTGARGVISTALAAFEGTVRGLGGFTLNSQSAALGALDAIQANQRNLANLIGVIGASSSRLHSASSVAAEQSLQSNAARSRIMDIDAAEESASFIRTSILRDTGAAILAQANQTPVLALTLLRL